MNASMNLSMMAEQLAPVEQELRESEERYRSLVEAAPDPILLANGLVLLANDAMARTLGYECAEHIRSCSTQKFFSRDVLSLLDTTLQSGSASGAKGQELTLVNARTGATRWVEAFAQVVHFRGEAAVQLVCRDITENRRAAEEVRRLGEMLEERVRQRTAKLEAAYRDLDYFSCLVSHELRGPLHHVSGYMNLLLDRPAIQQDVEARSHARRAMDAACRMHQLISDLLNFSRMSHSDLHRVPLRMNQIVSDVHSDLEWHKGERAVTWQIGDLPDAFGDEAMLKQVWQNLIANALKYTRTRADACIEIGATGDEVDHVYYVKDNGVGFDARYADKLFGVFERLHSSQQFEGTGVGLASVRRIVERHGGCVWAVGEVDRGAVFFFSLPKA